MKVKKLIKLLKKCPAGGRVMLSIDPEGNGHNRLWSVDPGRVYVDGEMYSTEWTADDCC